MSGGRRDSSSRAAGTLGALAATARTFPASTRSSQPLRPEEVPAAQGPRAGPGRPGRRGPTPGSRGPVPDPEAQRSPRPAAKTPRILYRGKSASSSKMGRQGPGGAGAAGRSMQRSQSRSSLSASFEALAGYFPCMNSLQEEEGEAAAGVQLGPDSRWSEGRRGERTVRSRVPPPRVSGTVPGERPRARQPRRAAGPRGPGELREPGGLRAPGSCLPGAGYAGGGRRLCVGTAGLVGSPEGGNAPRLKVAARRWNRSLRWTLRPG